MIIVHHLEKSRSLRVLWLLEELGVPYEVKAYKRDPKTMLAPSALRAIHPLGKSPLVEDEGQVFAETGAIVEYLADRYDNGALKPAAGSPEFLRYRYWLHYAEGSAMPPLLLKLIFDRLPQSAPFFLKPLFVKISDGVKSAFVNPQLKLHLDYLEGQFGERTWFAGDTFSAADIMMSFPADMAASRAGLDSSRPHLMNFLARIHARPAYGRALAKGGA